MRQTIKNVLVWCISPNTNKTYPCLWCYAYLHNKFEYQQVNHNGFRIPERTITDKKNIFEEVVKDFKMTNEDKRYLHYLLTNFDLDDYLDYGEYYSKELKDFLKKYNFIYASD